MKVSIITVCFNSDKTILQTIKSVNAQDYENIEHIFIDGGSSDNTLQLIKAYSKRLSCIVSEADEGIYDAMNKGVGIATGDIIAFLNSDDIYSNNQIICRVVSLMENYKLDCVAGDVVFFRENNPSIVVRRYSSKRFNKERIGWGWMPAQPAMFFKKEIFNKYGQFSKDYKIAGDFEFIARVFTNNPNIKYFYLQEVFVRMQMGGVSTAGWRSTMLLNKEVMRACRSNGIRTNWFKLLSKYPFKLLEFLIKD